MTRGNWMGCWNIMLLKRLTSDAVSGKDLAVLPSLLLFGPSIGSGQFVTLYYYSKPCIHRARASQAGSITLLLKEPDYSLSRLLSAPCLCYPGQEPPFGCCLPAAAHLCYLSTHAGCSGCTTGCPVLPRLCLGIWSYPTLP